jgi:hypothetical protein
MTRGVVKAVPALGAVLIVAACSAREPDVPSADFSAFADRYFSALYAFAPAQGTAAGFHECDAKLEDLSAGARDDT